MKKILLFIILTILTLILATTSYAACCANPNAGTGVCQDVLDRFCCPDQPQNLRYYGGNGPTDQPDCEQNYYSATQNCDAFPFCAVPGCCCENNVPSWVSADQCTSGSFDSNVATFSDCQNSCQPPPGCLIDTDCPTGEVCTDGACIDIQPNVSNCNDGSFYGQCSIRKPFYCDAGNLVPRCGGTENCGCPPDQTCQNDGSCVIPTQDPQPTTPPTDFCNNDNICGSNSFTFTDYAQPANFNIEGINNPGYISVTSRLGGPSVSLDVSAQSVSLNHPSYIPDQETETVVVYAEFDPSTGQFTNEKTITITFESYDDVAGTTTISVQENNAICPSDCPLPSGEGSTGLTNIVSLPGKIVPGEQMLLEVNVLNPSGVPTASASITDTAGQIIETVNLFDDGNHGDGNPNDNNFAGVWDSTGTPLGFYTATFSSEDVSGNQASTTASFEIVEQYGCIETIPGHNNLNENRINVVFVGINKDMNTFMTDVLNIIDYDETGTEIQVGSQSIIANGLMAIEPFKSNKNKFNFFYVDEMGSFDESQLTGTWGFEAMPEIDRLSSSCVVSNKIIYGLVSWSIINNAGFGGPGIGKIRMTPIASPRVGVHEFGHAFGSLYDERMASAVIQTFSGQNQNCYYSPFIDCTTTIVPDPKGGREVITCETTPNAITDCEENAEWRDLIGNGCGQDGIIDCDPSVDSEGAKNEITCVSLQCNQLDGLKATSNSLMLSSGIGNLFSFGPFNERILCNILQDYTGSVGGICNSLCMGGCPDGQKCRGGAC